MRKLIHSLNAFQLPAEVTREDWTNATRAAFSPYFKRGRQLEKNIDSLHTELINLARIIRLPEYTELLSWCLRLHRRVMKEDRQGAYGVLRGLFLSMQASDDAWMSIFHVSSPLEAGAAIQDRAYQLFSTIDGVVEGCLKPQLQILYSFARKDCGHPWPADVVRMDLGALVAEFPRELRSQVPLLLTDPDLSISMNQWRNIAAHKSFKLVGPQTLEVSYGKAAVQTRRLSIHRLRKVWYWVLRIHTAVRLANTITYLEHMEKLHALGLPKTTIRLSATLLGLGHSLSTVGFEVIGWSESRRDGVLTIMDRLDRPPIHALVHASQVIDKLSVGILLDPSVRGRLDRAGVSLMLPNGALYGTALISVQVADAFTLRKISMSEYMEQIAWNIGPEHK